jgi:hypothetical protein
MIVRAGAYLLGLCALLASPAAPQSRTAAPTPQVFAKLAGRWIGTGVLMGRPAEFSMSWETGEDGFVRLRFSNAWIGQDGSRTPVLSSEATYLPAGATALGVWLDDRPQRIRLEAALTDSSVVTMWTADTEAGRTDYIVRAPDSIIVRDFVLVDGSARPFAEATYRRAVP